MGKGNEKLCERQPDIQHEKNSFSYIFIQFLLLVENVYKEKEGGRRWNRPNS